MIDRQDPKLVEKTISEKRVYNGRILNIDLMEVELPDGRQAYREVTRHYGASAILPVDDEGNAYLVAQFRAPIGCVLLEVPAGKLDFPDEDRFEAAKRELHEETGFKADEWQYLGDMLSTPGFSNERISMYLARGLTAGKLELDDEEFLNVVKLPYSEVLRMVENGEIEDAKTICVVYMARKYLGV